MPGPVIERAKSPFNAESTATRRQRLTGRLSGRKNARQQADRSQQRSIGRIRRNWSVGADSEVTHSVLSIWAHRRNLRFRNCQSDRQIPGLRNMHFDLILWLLPGYWPFIVREWPFAVADCVSIGSASAKRDFHRDRTIAIVQQWFITQSVPDAS